MNFNVNHYVKVKLTEYGHEILKDRHDELRKGIKNIGEYKRKVDDEGYTRFQLWELMQKLGPYMKMGIKLPFETEIIIEEDIT